MFRVEYSIEKHARRIARFGRYVGDSLHVRARHRFRGGKRPVQLLLLSDGLNYQSECQFDPLVRNRRVLLRELGLVIHQRRIDPSKIRPSRNYSRYDIIGLKLNYKIPPETAMLLARSIAASKRPGASLVYCDGNDEANIQWPEILDFCDVYWKKHILRNRHDAVRCYKGSTNLTHYAFGENASDAPCSPCGSTSLARICIGASIGLDEKIFELRKFLESNKPLPAHEDRTHDVVVRADVPDNWMGVLRKPALQILETLKDSHRILLPRGRVSPGQYAREMLGSRICVSPFGYGEICWRDFEAVAYGCLLVKPDMGHVESRPDIFRPFETYVPVKWDFSDLSEKIIRYAADAQERVRIATNARQVLRECLEPEWFVGVMRELLKTISK